MSLSQVACDFTFYFTFTYKTYKKQKPIHLDIVLCAKKKNIYRSLLIIINICHWDLNVSRSGYLFVGVRSVMPVFGIAFVFCYCKGSYLKITKKHYYLYTISRLKNFIVSRYREFGHEFSSCTIVLTPYWGKQ